MLSDINKLIFVTYNFLARVPEKVIPVAQRIKSSLFIFIYSCFFAIWCDASTAAYLMKKSFVSQVVQRGAHFHLVATYVFCLRSKNLYVGLIAEKVSMNFRGG